MLEHGKIAGSYPRYTSLATKSDIFINTPRFEIKQDIYAFSLQPIESLKPIIQNKPQRIGFVRGTKVIETYASDYKISLFNHIDHLIGALQTGRVIMMFETEAVMERYKDKLFPLYTSQKPIIQGSVTQLLHYKHKKLADRLSTYFSENPIN